MSETVETWCPTCAKHVTAIRFNGGQWHCSGGNHAVEVDE